jgi:hypothetical protein
MLASEASRGARSRRDRHLQHAVALMGEQLIGLLDLIERVAMRDERCEIDACCGDHIQDPQEGSCDRTPFEPEERKKDQLWQLSACYLRVFGHHAHLAALV